jgi:hypothetical protein
MPQDSLGEENGSSVVHGAILLDDIEAYINHRRAYLLAKRDDAESDFGKAKFIGALQVINDFEAMLKQMHTVEQPRSKPTYASTSVPQNLEELGGKLLEKFGLTQSSINDFRDNSWRDKLLSTSPDKREQILLMSQFARNPEIINLVLQIFQETLGGKTSKVPPKASKTAASGPAPAEEDVGSTNSTCPYCGRSYRYAKSLNKHKETCPKKPAGLQN